MPQHCFLETPASLCRWCIPTADVEIRMPEDTLEFQRLRDVAAVLPSLPIQHVSVELVPTASLGLSLSLTVTSWGSATSRRQEL